MTKKEIQKRPAQVRQQMPQPTMQVVQEQRTYPSWMVPPEVLHGVNVEVDNGAERLFAMAEREQKAAHDFENKRLDHLITITKQEHSETILGQWLAFFVCALLIGLSALAIYLNHEIIGAIISCGGMAGIITAFVKKSWRTQNVPPAKR